MLTVPSLNGVLRYYPPEKQGLRRSRGSPSGILTLLRYYPPEKQGLRPKSHEG